MPLTASRHCWFGLYARAPRAAFDRCKAHAFPRPSGSLTTAYAVITSSPPTNYRIPPLEEQPNEPLVGLGELVLVDQSSHLAGAAEASAFPVQVLAEATSRS